MAICKCQELHAPFRKTTRTPHALRAYIPQVGTYFLLLICFMYERESTARQSSTAKTMKVKPNKSERNKIPAPSHLIIFCLLGTPCTGQKEKNRTASFFFRLVRRTPVSRPPRHRFGPGKASLSLCHGEPRHPPCVKSGAHRGPRSPARQCWY